MKTGFTLIELLVGIAILGLLATVSINGLSKFRLGQLHNGEVAKVIAVLNEARVRALSGDSARNFSVTIDGAAKSLTLSKITTEVGDTPYSHTTLLDQKSAIVTSLIGGNTITFVRFTGTTANTGTITLTTTSGANSKTTIIRVYTTGLATRE